MIFCIENNFSSHKLRRGALLTCASFLLNATYPSFTFAATPAAEQRYHLAISEARNNNLESAKAILQELLSQDKSNLAYRLDLIAIDSWKGDWLEAVDLTKGLDPQKTPLYVVKAWASAEKNLRHFDEAERLYQIIYARDSKQKDSLIAIASIDLARGNPDRAISRLEKMNPKSLNAADQRSRLETLILAKIVKQDYTGALNTSEDLLKTAPANRIALEAKFVSSMRLEVPHLALSTSFKMPSKDEATARRAAIAREIRWGEVETANSEANSAQKWETTDLAIDRALRHIEKLNTAETNDPDAALLQKYDLLIALVNRRRFLDATSLYETLAQQHSDIPPWVKFQIAGAYLALQKPKTAVALYEQGFALDAGSFNDRVSYIYALLESERFSDAITEADKLAETTPEWRNEDMPQMRKENDEYIRAQSLAAQVRGYSNDLASAEIRLKDLTHRAPGNEELAMARAEVEQLRGWPRAAYLRLKRLQTVNPNHLQAIPPTFNAALDMQAYREAERNLQKAQELLPDEETTRRMEKNWKIHQKRESLTRLSIGRNEGGIEGLGGNSTNDFRTLQFDTRLNSAPIAHNWRVFSHAGWDQSTGGSANYLRRELGVGLDYRSVDWDNEAEVFGLNGSESLGGFRVASSYHPNDNSNYALSYAKNGDDTPLRAFADGIRTDFVKGTYTYRWNELLAAGFGIGTGHFSDGNDRTMFNTWLQKRVLTRPRYSIDIRGDLDFMHNSVSNNTPVNYFNPEKQRSLSASMINRWVQWREYERQLSHELTVTFGQSWQSQFGGNSIGRVDYQFLYQFDPTLEWGAGISVARLPYDGALETDYAARTLLNWKF